MKNSRLILISLFVALTACTKADTKPDGVNGNSGTEGSATFRIKGIEGDATLLTVPETYKDPATKVEFLSTWRVPREANFRFTACIEDRSTRSEAIGHQFAVEIPGRGQIQDVPVTTGGGCFSWFESIPFTYFVKRSKWTVIERDIIGTGIHTGRIRARIAVNPWAADGAPNRDKGDQVRFLRDKPLNPAMLVEPAGADAALSGAALGEDKLYAGDVNIQTLRRGESSKGTYIRFNITMHPKVRFETQAGVPQMLPITTGDFYIIGHIVLNNAGPKLQTRTILTTGAALPPEFKKKGEVGILGQGRVIDGELVARLDAWIESRMPQGNLELAIKLIPKGVTGLGEFHGIYDLGTLKEMSSNFPGKLSQECREDGPCNVTEYLKTATNIDDLKRLSQATDNFPYLFDRMKLRFVQIQPGETTTERTVLYAASVCVTDAYNGDRPIGLEFKVTYKDTGEEHKLKTENDGCLYWSSNVFHYYYHPEEFIDKVVTIEKATGVKKDLKFHINPWDDKFTFGFDDIEFEPRFWEDLKKRKKIPARFFLSQYGYHTNRFQYNIDSLMNLEVKKIVLMDLQPRVLRYSGIINARKMTEPTRDGIWLMKVAIQKNYLDPSTAGMYVEKVNGPAAKLRVKLHPGQSQEIATDERLQSMEIQARAKEFISAQTALVRSTDGVVIQPVEFSMTDLRMMRIRSNFLVQLEPVDERQLQAHNVLSAGFAKTIDELLADRKRKAEELGKTPDNKLEEDIIKDEETKIRAMVEDRVALTRRLFDEISSQLYRTGKYQVNLAPYNLDESKLRLVEPMLADLQLQLAINDFTNLRLPSCAEIDCNRFIAPNSGLEKRTFVGPAIFLSNSLSESARATDNLDEAGCNLTFDKDDKFEKEMHDYQRELFYDSEDQVKTSRTNNTTYRFSSYFGSLHHLCNKHVDELIERQKENALLYQNNAPAIASMHHFVKSFHLDFASLTDEVLKSVEFNEETLKRCNMNLTQCMTPTNEFTVKSSELVEHVNRNLHWAEGRSSFEEFFAGKEPFPVKSTNWDASDIAYGLFAKSANVRERRFTACALAIPHFLEAIKRNGVKPVNFGWEAIEREMMRGCIFADSEPVFMDRKLRVLKTATEGDSYVFQGGYQMNINVAQNFSINRSDSYSRGWGFEATDVVAPFLKNMPILSAVLKPFSYKWSGSESFASSDGTSVSDSTYLVSQIAKFQVKLDQYENCVGLKIAPGFYDWMRVWSPSGIQSTINQNVEKVAHTRPLFVCEGRTDNPPKFVPEMYFYFTQHFTEGDMLDQADLYNHPWLLALRGYRDFSAFVESIHGQEAMNLWDAVTGKAFSPDNRPIDWPLAHLRETYRQMTPNFPGIYTVLEEGEGMTDFPLEKRLELTDSDPNHEIFDRQEERVVPGSR